MADDIDRDGIVFDVQDIPCTFDRHSPLADTLELWKNWADGRAAPTWRDVDLMQLPSTLAPQTLVVDVIDGGRDYRYRYWGTMYTDQFGFDDTGNLLSNSVGPNFIQMAREQLRKVVDDAKPHAFDVAIRAPRTGLQQTKINLRLPIMDEPSVVSKVITVSIFNQTTREDTARLREAFMDSLRSRLPRVK